MWYWFHGSFFHSLLQASKNEVVVEGGNRKLPLKKILIIEKKTGVNKTQNEIKIYT